MKNIICLDLAFEFGWFFRVLCFFRSYHDGEHYNSVRLKDDHCDGPARPVVIKVVIIFAS